MGFGYQFLIVAGIPVAAVLVDCLASAAVSERHHTHHDTYQAPASLFHSLVVIMVAMGILGIAVSIMLGGMNLMSYYESVMMFFVVFEIVLFAFWFGIRRYAVATYSDYMRVIPFVGKTVMIPYKDITALRWTASHSLLRDRNLHIFVGDKEVVSLWNAIDIDQILGTIDRNDVLQILGAWAW